jgi:hypothetical protein
MAYQNLDTVRPAQPPLLSSVPFVLTPPDIREFQQIIEEHCGISLSETEAWNRATELVALYRMFLGPIPEDPTVIGLPGLTSQHDPGRSTVRPYSRPT